MKETQEIPRERWSDYLNALSNRSKDLPVRIEVEGQDLGDQMLAQQLPLVGISCELKGSEANAIEVTLGKKEQGSANITHMIEDPERLYVEETENGQVRCLDIETRAKVKTLIFFAENQQTVNR